MSALPATPSPTAPLKLDLGAGTRPREGFVAVDSRACAGYQRAPEAYSGDYSKSMTVAELRELLSRFPDSAFVNCTCAAGSCATGVYGLNRYGMEQGLPGSEPVLTVTLEGY